MVCSWYYYLSWGGSSFSGDKQADLSGSAFLSDNSGAVRLVILKKMTLDDLGKSANMTKMSLRFEGVFGISPPFLCGEQAVCKTLRRTHIYEVKYSALYFTWKLDRICAKILDKMLHILASNSLGGLPVIRYSNDADKEN